MECTSLVYIAKGGEKYITIGSFLPVNLEKIQRINSSSRLATVLSYYFIDNVEIFEITDESECQKEDFTFEYKDH